MLMNAKLYENELMKLYNEIAYDPFYQYHVFSDIRTTFKVPEDTGDGHYFVSVINDEVIGLIYYCTRRIDRVVDSLGIVHFGGEEAKNNYAFGKDVIIAVKDIFEKFGFVKINFSCIIGNPAEKTYDRLINSYGGRIAGIFRNDTRLLDGKLYSKKVYEILAEEYFASVEKKRRSAYGN